MVYHEAADFLFGLRWFRPKPGTEPTARLLAHLEITRETLEAVGHSPAPSFEWLGDWDRSSLPFAIVHTS